MIHCTCAAHADIDTRKLCKTLIYVAYRLFSGEHKDMLNEVKLLASIDHPNIITCLGHFFETSVLYVVLEWAAGGKTTPMATHCSKIEL